VHRTFERTVQASEGGITVGDRQISVSAIRSPAELPWKEKNVDIVFECTGIFRKRDQVEMHMKAGAPRVLISAPASGEDLTVVKGVNCSKLDKQKHHIVSNGSCTTNCLAPVARVIQDTFGIKYGLMTTIHSYTNDQNILDLPHEDLRRARAAAVSMIPTSTGAAKAIALVMPELKGKMDGMAIRVPTPNVSIVDVTFEVSKATTKEEVNKVLKDAANGSLKGILGFSEEPLVSVDYMGNTLSSIIDGEYTTVMNGTMVKILSWYDNEAGFSARMLDIARLMV
jgi:glyceraldehyde 3-phosphate dehydrogenase